MGRKKGDGRGRLSNGRKGIPNKEKPEKEILRNHSIQYITPRPQVGPDGKSPRELIYAEPLSGEVKTIILADSKGRPLELSDMEVDMLQLRPADRVNAELRLMKFHTPEMKAVDMDIQATVNAKTIEDLLTDLCLPDEEED